MELIREGSVMFVKVPTKADNLTIRGNALFYDYPYFEPNDFPNPIYLPEGNLTILGKAFELTEEQKVLTIMHSSISDKTIVITGRLDVFYDAFLEAHQIDNNYILILKNEG